MNDTFGYDKASRLTSATSARYGNAVSRAYDDVGQVLLERLSVNGIDFDVIHAYDAAHRQTNVTYPNGKQLVRTFTARNQLETLTYDGAAVATRTYDENMRLYQTTFGSGRVEYRGYRADSLLDSTNTPGVSFYVYSYDNNKNKVTEITNGGRRDDFTYDHEERLATYRSNYQLTNSQDWTLSKAGDWDVFTTQGVAQTRTHNDVHELTQINGTLLAHDEKGNLATNSNGQTYTWDFENRMASAIVPAGSTVGVVGLHSYTYDALGRRVTKTVNGATAIFVSDGLQEISEYAGGALPANATRSFVYGSYIDEPLMMVNHIGATAGSYYYVQNNVYSVGTLMDQAGAVVEHYTYTPYGQTWFLNAARNQLLPGSTVGQPYGFTGRRRDDETGLYYYRARYYSAELGRFIGRDPILGIENHITGGAYSVFVAFFKNDAGYLRADFSAPMYAYTNSRPVRHTDPSGLKPWSELECDKSSSLGNCTAGTTVPDSSGIRRRSISIFDKTDNNRGLWDEKNIRGQWWLTWFGNRYEVDSASEISDLLVPLFDDNCACIDNLRLVAHGAVGAVLFGKGSLSNATIKSGKLDKLRPYFCDNATIVLDACNVCAGEGGGSMPQALADQLGVRVIAYSGEVGPLLSGSGKTTYEPKGVTPKPVQPLKAKENCCEQRSSSSSGNSGGGSDAPPVGGNNYGPFNGSGGGGGNRPGNRDSSVRPSF